MKKVIFAGLVVVAVLGLWSFYGRTPATPSTASLQSTSPRAEAYQVVRVVDGDTIVVQDKKGSQLKIRLIGIDTPEVVDPRRPVQCFGKEASAKMRELVVGKFVRLEKDPTGDTIDNYKRSLRHVYVDNKHVNAEMIRAGYAYAEIRFQYSSREQFKEYQREAEKKKLGLWNEKNCANLKKSLLGKKTR